MAEDNSDKSGPGEVLLPTNFLAYTAAAIRLLRTSFRSVALSFCLVGVFIAVFAAAGGTLADTADSVDFLYVVLYAQLIALPLLGSLVSARTSRVMALSLAGRNISLRDAGAGLRGYRSHLFAAAMLASFLTLALTFAMGLLGAFLGSHLMLGPPVLAQVISLERATFSEAWMRMKELARGQALRTFLYLLCGALMVVMAEILISGIIFSILSAAIDEGVAVVVNTPIAGIVSGFGLALMSAFTLESYLELRARQDEDFDFEELATELEEGELEEDEPETGE